MLLQPERERSRLDKFVQRNAWTIVTGSFFVTLVAMFLMFSYEVYDFHRFVHNVECMKPK